MTTRLLLGYCCCLALFAAASPATVAQDNVTIPKSRLEELERKEAELRRLKGETNPPAAAAQQPAQSPGQVQTPIAARPEPPSAPVITELPPLKPGEIVEAPELALHFSANRAAAEQRYLNKQVAVQGEIIRFHKPILSRSYGVALKTDNPAITVICNMKAPEGYDATYTAKNATELVGRSDNTQTVLAHLGERVVVQGRCKGLKDGAVTLSGASLRPAP